MWKTLFKWKEAERIIGPYILTATKTDDAYFALRQELDESHLSVTYGSTRRPPFEHVIEFSRASAERGDCIDPVLQFLNLQWRPAS
jgi:hypothetical protein